MKRILILSIRIYQKVSASFRLLGGVPLFTTTTCKFYPSCSEYATLAIQAHGPLRGSAKAVNRVCRCHPWSAGGVDFPPTSAKGEVGAPTGIPTVNVGKASGPNK